MSVKSNKNWGLCFLCFGHLKFIFSSNSFLAFFFLQKYVYDRLEIKILIFHHRWLEKHSVEDKICKCCLPPFAPKYNIRYQALDKDRHLESFHRHPKETAWGHRMFKEPKVVSGSWDADILCFLLRTSPCVLLSTGQKLLLLLLTKSMEIEVWTASVWMEVSFAKARFYVGRIWGEERKEQRMLSYLLCGTSVCNVSQKLWVTIGHFVDWQQTEVQMEVHQWQVSSTAQVCTGNLGAPKNHKACIFGMYLFTADTPTAIRI